jgi:hypothetical protein
LVKKVAGWCKGQFEIKNEECEMKNEEGRRMLNIECSMLNVEVGKKLIALMEVIS